jgi:hypothetical protein
LRSLLQAQIDEAQRQKEEEARAEEERRQAMKRRVQQLCDQGHEQLECAEKAFCVLAQLGPTSSDTVMHECMQHIHEILVLVDEADETFDRAIKAGAYYGLRGDADEGMQHGQELHEALAKQEARLQRENNAFRRPLKVFANFVRLENADEFAMIHEHDKQRRLNDYFAAVLLQAYVRRKAERVRFCAISQRSRKAGGRFVPVSAPASLALAPLDDNHSHITAQRAGMQSNRIALLRTQQLQDHLGFSLMSPTSPVSPHSPLRGLAPEGRLDPLYVAEQTLSPRGLLYAGRGRENGGNGAKAGGGHGGGGSTPSQYADSSRCSSAGGPLGLGPPVDFGW